SPFVVNLLGNWSRPAEDSANISWVQNLFAAIRPAMTPGVYINFMSGDEDDRTPEAYRERWDRLVAVKSKYDPNNFFRLNQNIPPKREKEQSANSRYPCRSTLGAGSKIRTPPEKTRRNASSTRTQPFSAAAATPWDRSFAM